MDAAVETGAEKGVMLADSPDDPERWGEEPIRAAVRESVGRPTEYGAECGFEVVAEDLK